MNKISKILTGLLFFFLNSNFNVIAGNSEKELSKILLANYYESKYAPAAKKEQASQAELKEKVREYLAAQPVKFLENKGQMMDINSKPVPFVLFKAEAPGMNVYITEKGLTYVFVKAEEEEKHEREKEKEKGQLAGPEREDIKMEMAWVNVYLEGANIQRNNIVKEGQSTEHFNYFFGHCPEGIYDVYQYDKITIKEVYPGVDWVFYNSQKGGMKYDFVVHPGADPSQIKLLYEGDMPLKIEEDGSISINTKLGTLNEAKPYSYQEGNSNEIESNYKLTTINKNKTLLEFYLASYNQKTTLIIDPQLVWSTFYGTNTSNQSCSISTDAFGNLFATGNSASPSFPVLNPAGGAYFQATIAGGFQSDVIIIKFNNSGVRLWATLYGGSTPVASNWDNGNSITCDNTGNVYVCGNTSSLNLPTFNPMGGAYFQGVYGGGNWDAIILKFSNNGIRLWATYYGGNGDDWAHSVTCDNSGNVFVTGSASSNFPVFNPMGGAYFQGAMAGFFSDAFILKFNNSGVRLWATFYGGSGPNWADVGQSITCDNTGNVYVAGWTRASNFPTFNPMGGAYFQGTNGGSGNAEDVFILKFSNNGVRLWATYYGGSGDEQDVTIICDNNGNVFLNGTTSSTNFPTLNPGGGAYFQGAHAGGLYDHFILKFSSSGVRLWATYYGGSSWEFTSGNSSDNLAIDACGNVYVSFSTYSSNIPTQSYQVSCGGFNDNSLAPVSDQFIIKFTNSGQCLWATYIGGNGNTNNDWLSPLTTDNAGNLFVSGNWTSITNIATYPLVNPGSGAYYVTTTNTTVTHSSDIFFMKFIPIVPSYLQNQTNPSICNCNGVATVSVTCGEPPFTYQWSNGVLQSNVTNSTSSINGLCPGVYQVTVTSCPNFTYTTSYTLTGAASNLTVNTTVQNGNCTSPTGSVTINSVTNGVPNYTLAEGSTTLAAGFNTPYTLSNVSVGTHTYVLTSANGCSTTFTAQILPGGSQPNLSVISPVTLNCIPTSTLVTASSTTTPGPLTYTWSGPSVVSGANTATATVNQAGNYTVTIAQGACTNTAVVTVVANTNTPNISILNQPTLTCTNPTAVLQGTSTTAGVTYTWLPQNVNTATITVNTAGNYTLMVSNPLNGCTSTSVVTITQNTLLPNFSISNQPTLTCANPIAVLQGTSTTAGVTYTWLPQNVNTASITVNTAGNYTLMVSNPLNGCINTSVVAVSQNTTQPNVSITNQSTLTCTNVSALLNGTSTTSGATYSWLPQNVNTATTTVNTSGNYTLTVTDPLNGCVNTSVAAVSQNTTQPNVSITNQPTLTCANPSAVLQGTSTTSGATYNWLPPNVNSATANVTTSGNFTLTVTDPLNGCTNTSVVAVTQNTTQPNVSISNQPTLTCANPSAVLQGTSTTSGVTYNWTPISVTSNTAAVNMAGIYTLTVIDPSNGCLNSTMVNVLQSGTIPNLSFANQPTLTCINLSTVLQGTSTTSGAIYNWLPQNVNSATVNVSAAGNYTLTVTDPLNGCKSTSVIAVSQNTTQPSLTAISSNSLNCLLNSSTLTASSSNTSVVFAWSGGSLSNVVNPAIVSVPATYSVTATDPLNGCTSTSVVTVLQNTTTPNLTASTSNHLNCNFTNAILSATSTIGGLTYQWSGGPNQSNYTVNQGGNYTVMVTNPSNGCSNTAIVSVTASPMFTANISVLSQINCFGANNGALQINVSGGSLPFSITNLNTTNTIGNINSFPVTLNNLSAGNYSIEVSDANGCKQILYSSITQPSQLNVTVAGNSTLCSGSTASLTSNVSGGTTPYSFNWAPTGGTNPNITATPNVSTTYTLTVTDNNGCAAATSIAIVVNPSPDASVINNRLVGCAPVCASFSLTQAQGLGYTYNWSFSSSVPTPTSIASNVYNPEICFSTPGTYNASILISTPQGCSVTVNYSNIVTVYPRPNADFYFTPERPNILDAADVNFFNQSVGATSYQWYNVNYMFSTQTNPTYFYQEPGTFLVTLIASNPQCSDTISKIIVVDDEFSIYIPNTFTPNGDNLNDTFYPVMTGPAPKAYSFMIFDRWGELLYKSDNPNETQWNGAYKNELCKDDVYTWKLIYTSSRGKSFEKTGHVTLIK